MADLVDLDELARSNKAFIEYATATKKYHDVSFYENVSAAIQELRLAREVVEAVKTYCQSYDDTEVTGNRDFEYYSGKYGLDNALAAYEQSIKANSSAGEIKEKG